jgi:hypothetical protein
MDDRLRSSELLPMIRAQVRDRLMQSAAFMSLPMEKRTEIAHDTVNAIHYIVGGADGTSRPSSVTVSGNTPLGQTLADDPDPAGETAGKRFAQSGAIAAQQGAEALASLVERVNFPRFVAGLIDGVFNAIVTSSIKQMEAYADLVKNVSKSVEQYMKDNVSENNARDYLADRYPGHLEIDIGGDKPRLKAREDADDQNMPDFEGDLGLKEPMTSLDDDKIEKELVPAARRRIAMDRQQLLATMVMMGVNRLVVTNGAIEASVLFELDTKDEVKRKYKQKTTADWASQHESQWGAEGSYSRSGGGWFSDDTDEKSSWYSKGSAKSSASFNVSTTKSEDSTAKVDLHAKLSGKVNVNFKSDYFPMEKMVDAMQINRVREKTAAGGATADQGQQQGASGATPTPAVRQAARSAAPARA